MSAAFNWDNKNALTNENKNVLEEKEILTEFWTIIYLSFKKIIYLLLLVFLLNVKIELPYEIEIVYNLTVNRGNFFRTVKHVIYKSSSIL